MYVAIDPKFYDHDKFDLIDFEMDTTLPQVIKDFRGVSGGGLWDVQIFPTRGGKFDLMNTACVMVAGASRDNPTADCGIH